MQNVLRNTDEAGAMPRRQGRVPTILREYRNHFGLFWRVMLPVIIVSLVLYSALFLFSKLWTSEAQWTFSTSGNITGFPGSTENYRPSSKSTTGVGSSIGFHGSSFDIGLLWLAMCPLALIIVHRHREEAVTANEVWQQTRRKAMSILGTCLLMLLVAGGPFIILVLIMAGFTKFVMPNPPTELPASFPLLMLVAGVVGVYYFVKWSLCNQCVIIENLPAVAALRRSSELVKGRWGQFFGMYLLLVWVGMVFTIATFSLILLLLSIITPEFAPMREELQSGKFFGLFVGGQVEITLQNAPIWAIGTMIALNTLTNAVLAPIWAILTTHLYMERAGVSEQHVSG